ncbi:KilA-N domain-containing protein [Pseudomonas aeruginosa]|nr:KilA-N domain-containing protein [Pseudomonas aeruginosa]
MSKQLTVCGVDIKQDAEGRYCLNDLHKAAGGERRHDTREFLDRDSTQELVQELASEMTDFPVNKTRGRFGGTFVVKELVYAYAMWISPKFHLEVIRSYDRLATEGVAVHASAAEAVLDDPLTYMEKVIAQAKVLKAERDRLALENKEMAPKAVVFDNCVALRQESLATFVRTLEGVNTMAIKGDLADLGYLYRTVGAGKYRVYAKYRNVLFTEKLIAHPTRPVYEILPTPEGKKLIVQLYRDGKLTMKKAYAAA